MRVALTIDAEHSDRRSTDPRTNAEAMLDVLKRCKIKATFFVQGKWAESYPDLARRIATEDHLVGNHSHNHCRFPLLTDDGIKSDLGESREALARLCCETHQWFRLPGGAGSDDRRIKDAVRSQGYEHFGWTGEINDWMPEYPAPKLIEEQVRDIRGASQFAVPLLHTWPDPSAQVLERVVERFSGEVEFVRLDDLGDVTLPGWAV
jgi:peptidoglycan/xylan/chitin deacetylase (PgdA/CDA1 family)